MNGLLTIKFNRQFQIVLESEVQPELSVIVARRTGHSATVVHESDLNTSRGMTRIGAIEHLANDRSPIGIGFSPNL